MKKLAYEINQEAYNKLSGLAYRIADNAYMIERYGYKDTEIERKENHKTITLLFDELDRLQVPFWLQNITICFAENWRKYKSENLASWYRQNTSYEITVNASCL